MNAELLKDIAGFLVPPFWSLSLPRDYRGAPLAKRLSGQRVLTLNVGVTSITAGVIRFDRRKGAQFSALAPAPCTDGRLTAALLSKYKTESKTRFVALTYGAAPEGTEITLQTNVRHFQSEDAFHIALAQTPELFVQKPRTGFGYRGIPHPELPIAIVSVVDPSRERDDAKLCDSVGLKLVRAQSSLLSLANVGLADSRVGLGAPLLVIDQSQCLFVSSTGKGQWEQVRCRKLRDGAADFAKFVTEVIKPVVKVPQAELLLLDTKSSGELNLSVNLSAYTVREVSIPGVDSTYIPNCTLAAA